MAKRFDIMTPRAGRDDKTFWTRIGTAWQNDKGGIQLVFDALPIPDKEGRVVANLFEPRDDRAKSAGNDQADSRQRAGGGWHGAAPVDDLDDDIPF
jgi:hypothetical protein